jgi:mannose-6-phosphate isomerase-like protein (cupin superfamily)
MDKLAIAKYKAWDMGDKSITKVSAATAPRGPMGQKYLASGIRLSMRLWEGESPDTESKAETEANYETVGYVIAGRAELHIEGQVVDLEPGDSWIVPKALATATKSWKRSQRWRPPPRLRKCTAGTKASQPAERRHTLRRLSFLARALL